MSTIWWVQTNSNPCDSITTIKVTDVSSTSQSFPVSLCFMFNFVWVCLWSDNLTWGLSFWRAQYYIVNSALCWRFGNNPSIHQQTKDVSGIYTGFPDGTLVKSASANTEAHQALPPMWLPRQEHWSGVATSFSRGTSHPRDWIHVSRIGKQIILRLIYHFTEVPKTSLPCSCC